MAAARIQQGSAVLRAADGVQGERSVAASTAAATLATVTVVQPVVVAGFGEETD